MNSMGKKDIIPVDLERPLHEKLKKSAETKNISLRKYVNELLVMNLEKEEFMSKYAPMIQYISAQDNKIILKDNKKNQFTEVFKKNSNLYCTLDESTDCIHIHYVLALPELGKI